MYSNSDICLDRKYKIFENNQYFSKEKTMEQTIDSFKKTLDLKNKEKMSPIILFRKNLQEEGEFDVCRKYFPTIEYRSELSKYIAENELYKTVTVIPRYSALPYYKDLEKDIDNLGGKLINSYEQHRWIANFEWYNVLKEFTPETWDDTNFFSAPQNQQYIVKGRTNSKKFSWNKQMFAESKRQAIDIGCDLMTDSMIGEQGIIYRKYVPLETYEIGLNGLPFTNEWRFFFYRTNLLASGYYWSNSEKTDHIIESEGIEFARRIALIIINYINFVVIDIGKTKSGDWVIIELNDASMSGLSECRADELYSSLKKVLT